MEVFGKAMNIPAQVVAMARGKASTMPIIIFCTDPNQYKELIPEAEVFVGNEVGMLLAILENLR